MLKNRKMEWTTLKTISVIVGIFVGIIGIFGGIPGIKNLFFSKPAISIEGFMPVVVFDESNSTETTYPKFSLNGVLKVVNSNSFDVFLNEMRIYGRTTESSGKYKFPGNKPIVFEMRLLGTARKGDEIVKGYGIAYIRFNISHFDNDTEPNIMLNPLKAVGDPNLGIPVFYIYSPTFNQLFKWNERRIPYEFVNEVKNGSLAFSLVFNNELIRIPPRKIIDMHRCTKTDWENAEYLAKIYNVKVDK